MKKVVFLIIYILFLLLGMQVYAKDTIYSLNKYSEEEYQYILKSYKEDTLDGFVVAGTYNHKKNTQIVLVKYNKDGSISWEYDYEKDSQEKLNGLSYLYDEENDINGYLLVVKNTEDIVFVKVDLNGKLIEEVSLNLGNNIEINDLKPIKNDEEITGYILVGKKADSAFMTQYDKNLNQVWIREYVKDNTSQELKEVIYISNVGYYGLVSIDENKTYQLLKYDLNGNILKIVKDDFEENDIPHLKEEKNTYIIYGITQEVKLPNNEMGSYYVMKFDTEEKEIWETVGDSPVDSSNTIQLQTNTLEDETKEYLILLTNRSDNSIEVVRLGSDGIIQDKVKKIKNDYYRINEFISSGNTMYFVGQINCPEDDNCDYDAKSLFLVSDEDKVIEVQDKDSKTILIITGIILLGTVIGYGLRKRKKLIETKKKH